jgi:uncharacterized protein (DUF608 family)
VTIQPNPDWPVLTSYEGRRLDRVALPLGGIGTGTVALGGRGDLRDWEIVNRPAKGFSPDHAFFALRAQPTGGPAVVRALEGVLRPSYEAARGRFAPNHSLPRFRSCEFLAAYPFGQVLLSDPDVPLAVGIEAFNPFVPADPERSGLPVAILRFVLDNPGGTPVAASVAGSLQNFVGTDGTNGAPAGNVNEARLGDGLGGVLLRSRGVPPDSEQWGTIALTTTATEGVSHRTAWADVNWGDALLDFWDDFGDDGRLEDRPIGTVEAPVASLAVELEIPARSSRSVTFLLTWHFPNRRAWGLSPRGGVNSYTDEIVGNHYATRFDDAWDAARAVARDLPTLETDTLRFVRAFCAGDLPPVVKEAALYNLSTLRTQTCFRTADGRFYGWEGCNDTTGSCLGSCTHVWNYEQATTFLFGSLARSMREIEFLHTTRDDGHMSFRVLLPLEEQATGWGLAAADGQMGCLMKLYRDWQLSGDDDFLRALWPRARKSLEFCWITGGWDADRDGVMEGCQHNTMDVEYFGPNPQMGIWYLGALRAAEEMARHLGEVDFAAECRDLFQRGRAWLDGHLFNGEYYEHQIRPVDDESRIAPGLRHHDMGARDLTDPSLQLGAGCLVDQLVGQYMAEVCGLGYLTDPAHVRATLRAIMRYNFREDLYGHFNHLRTFALNDEAALLMASYPRGNRPKRPFPYYNEVMTGFEYTAAVHMLYEGQRDEGLRVIEAIRARYDGERRSPFDEAECGHHYARAMASWAAVLALTGFRYSGVGRSIRFAPSAGSASWFWSTGDAWGTVRQEPAADGARVELSVLGGALPLARIELGGAAAELQEPRVLRGGERAAVTVPPA